MEKGEHLLLRENISFKKGLLRIIYSSRYIVLQRKSPFEGRDILKEEHSLYKEEPTLFSLRENSSFE